MYDHQIAESKTSKTYYNPNASLFYFLYGATGCPPASTESTLLAVIVNMSNKLLWVAVPR